MKRTLIALLSIGLCLSSVAGCKEAGTPSPSSTPTTVSTSSESESTQPNGELDWQIGSDTPSSFVASGGSTLSGQGTTVSKSSGNGTTQGPHATVNPEKNYETTIWTSGDEPYLMQAILEFQKNNKNVKVMPVNAANRTVSALKTAMAAKNAPDMVLMDQVYIGTLGQQGLTYDLARFGAGGLKSKYIPSCWNAVTNGNTVYGLPFSGNVLIMVYNKSVFSAAGVQIPKTYDELRNVSRTIKSVTGKPAFLPAVIALDNTNDANYSAFFFATWLWRNGGELISSDGKKAVFNSDAGVKAAEQIVDLLKDGTATRSGGEADVYNGNIGMIQLGTWVTQYMTGPNKQGDLGVFMLPELKAGVPQYSGLGLGALCITTSCKAPEAAYKFLEFYSTSMKYQIQSTRDKYNTICGMPSLVGGKDQPEYNSDVWKTFFDQFEVAKARPTVDGWEYIEVSIARALTRIAEGKDAREQLNAAVEEANRILARN